MNDTYNLPTWCISSLPLEWGEYKDFQVITDGYDTATPLLESLGLFTTTTRTSDIIFVIPRVENVMPLSEKAEELADTILTFMPLKQLGSLKRLPWWKERPPTAVFFLPRRPDLQGSGVGVGDYCWVAWDYADKIEKGFVFTDVPTRQEVARGREEVLLSIMGEAPAIIDDTRVQTISFSGGRTSAYMTMELVNRFRLDAQPYEIIFTDTGAEHHDTYRFIKDFEKFLGEPITKLVADCGSRKGFANSYKVISNDDLGKMNGWKAMVGKYDYLPMRAMPHCTRVMKIEPYHRYCQEKYGVDNYITWIGIRSDEDSRAKPKRNYRYLCQIDPATSEDVKDYLKQFSWDLQIPKHLGNCVYCIKKSNKTVVHAIADTPEDMHTEFIEVLNLCDNPNRKIYDGHTSFETLQSLAKDAVLEPNFEDKDNPCSDSCEIF